MLHIKSVDNIQGVV